MTAPTSWTICVRCGDLAEASILDPEFCATCLPDPESAARRAADAARRLHTARRDAARTEGRPLPALPRPPVAPRTGRRPLSPLAFWLTSPKWSAAHLVVGNAVFSVCGKVRGESGFPARPGMRGCRSCAMSMRLIASRQEMVTT